MLASRYYYCYVLLWLHKYEIAAAAAADDDTVISSHLNRHFEILIDFFFRSFVFAGRVTVVNPRVSKQNVSNARGCKVK